MIRKLFIIVGVLLICIGVGMIGYEKLSFLYDSYIADVDKSKEIVTIVDNDYKAFNSMVSDYKEDIVLVSKSLDVYYDEFSSKNENILKNINNVKLKLESISPINDRMSINCKYDLNNLVMEQQCDMFSINYNSMIDAYVEMVSEYNNFVEKYNEYAVNNGKGVVNLFNDSLN